MDLFLPHTLLRRYSERFDQPEVRMLADDNVQVRVAQQRVLPDGSPGGLMWLVARGAREGERVRFPIPQAFSVEGAVNPSEVAALASAGEKLLPTLAELCPCARAKEDCDCCPSCHGAERGAGGAICETCAGLGYLEKE